METQIYRRADALHYREISPEGNGVGIIRLDDCELKEHSHGEAEISLLFGGTCPRVVGHQEGGNRLNASLPANAVTFIPPGQPHRIQWRGIGQLLNFYLPERQLIEFLECIGYSRTPLRFTSNPDHALRGVGTILMDEFRTTGGLTPALIDHAAALLLRPIIAATGNGRGTGAIPGHLSLKRLSPTIDFIQSQPERDFTILELANLCNSSPYHFARSFAARVGAPPFAFQRELRIRKAKTLLLDLALSIESIAYAVGFKNPTHFSRTFHRYVGVSPREFRRAALTVH